VKREFGTAPLAPEPWHRQSPCTGAGKGGDATAGDGPSGKPGSEPPASLTDRLCLSWRSTLSGKSQTPGSKRSPNSGQQRKPRLRSASPANSRHSGTGRALPLPTWSYRPRSTSKEQQTRGAQGLGWPRGCGHSWGALLDLPALQVPSWGADPAPRLRVPRLGSASTQAGGCGDSGDPEAWPRCSRWGAAQKRIIPWSEII